MRLLEVLPLLEVRKNPEQNPRLSAYDQLLKYANNPNVYISMTYVPKLGINPGSHWDTPNGIYCYPLQTIWHVYNIDADKTLDNLPFRSLAPYIQVFEWNGRGHIVDVGPSKYTESDLGKDIVKLKKMFPDAIDRIEYGIGHAARQNIPASKLFNVVMLLSKDDEKFMLKRHYDIKTKKMGDYESEKYSPTGRQSANIYRALGYSGFVDYGNKIIHPNEPYQAVFLSKEYVKQLDTILNKSYKRYKEEQLKVSDDYIEGGMYIGNLQGHKIILARPETEKKLSYSGAVEYCKSLGKGWHLPTVEEMVYITKNFINNWAYENNSLKNSPYWTITTDDITILNKQKIFYIGNNAQPDRKLSVIAVKNILPNGTYSKDGYIKYPKLNGGIYIGDYKGKKMILSPKSLESEANIWTESNDYINQLEGWKIPTKDEWTFLHDNANLLPVEYALIRKNNKYYWTSDANKKGDHWYYELNENIFHIDSLFGDSSNDEYCSVRPIKLV